jgi:hypothetical protein
MEQDIRKLFNTEDETDHQLPLIHRGEFQSKLKQATQKQKPSFKWAYKYAAIAILFLSLGYIFIQQDVVVPIEPEETALQLQLKEVEQQYLGHIEKEWESFKTLTDDDRLIQRYEQKLEDLNEDYQELSLQFQDDRNNILVLESLIENLKLRLQILKDIQHHIRLLNQKNEQNEIII